ncbi:HTH domain-containing protein [Erysipelotrichaceae bacterium OttesenSCG-928-M19]|nr:HTH domain-containing protein [Erysipelotrichaceae bacterium OttesenSCG-928-M19]
MNRLENINYLHLLYDAYGVLLTKKQQDYFEMYYFEDLSLAEIAENLNVSRNAIHNNLQATLSHLHNYESKLGIIKKERDLNNYLDDLVYQGKITNEDLSNINKIFNGVDESGENIN